MGVECQVTDKVAVPPDTHKREYPASSFCIEGLVLLIGVCGGERWKGLEEDV
jgi:hypothetical protein